MTRAAPTNTDDALLEEAAGWFTRLNEAHGAERAALERALQAWLDADPARAAAFARVSEAWVAVEDHAAAPEVMSLRRDALDHAHEAAARRWRKPRNWRAPAMIAASVLCLIGAAAIVAWGMIGAGDRYVTAVGERRSVTLADNSRVAIDADSIVAVAFEERLRLVRLERGQAFFDVEKDPTRPFVVEAAGRRVVALGTAFNVELLGRELRVTLVEGRVAVRGDAGQAQLSLPGAPLPAGVAELNAGEQLTVLGQAQPLVTRPANLATTTSWREGKLIFDDEPLGDAVARVQRYSRVRLALNDRSLRAIRISGVFNAGDVTAFVGALEAYYPIKAVSADGAGIVLHERR